MGGSAIFGVDVGSITNDLRDSQFGDVVKAKGWTVGAYAVYDPGPFFLKGLTTYSSLNGNSTRHIDFAGLSPGVTFSANPTGSPDVRMWTFGLHGGARLSMGKSSVLTPYLDLDYANAKLEGFSELNGGPAGLTMSDSNSNHSFATGGVKWATDVRGMVPEINLGYRYRLRRPALEYQRLLQRLCGRRLRHCFVCTEEGRVPGWRERRWTGWTSRCDDWL